MLVSQPEFALSRNAALHMENATPLPLSARRLAERGGRADAARMFQEDAVALRCVLACQLGEAPHRLHGARNERHLVMPCTHFETILHDAGLALAIEPLRQMVRK